MLVCQHPKGVTFAYYLHLGCLRHHSKGPTEYYKIYNFIGHAFSYGVP